MYITITAGVQGDSTYVGRCSDGTIRIITKSALDAMSRADYDKAVRDIPDLLRWKIWDLEK